MHGSLAPMSARTVQFAKSYRAEPVRPTRRGRTTVRVTPWRQALVAHVAAVWTAAVSPTRGRHHALASGHPRSEP